MSVMGVGGKRAAEIAGHAATGAFAVFCGEAVTKAMTGAPAAPVAPAVAGWPGWPGWPEQPAQPTI
jgi:hypothetical protein